MSKILLLSDLHASVSRLKQLMSIGNQEEIKAIIFAGDFLNGGENLNFADAFLWTIQKWNKPFFWVRGNNDFGLAADWFEDQCSTIEGKIVKFANIKLAGAGDSLFSDQAAVLEADNNFYSQIGGSILITHYPPPDFSVGLQMADQIALPYSRLRANQEMENNNATMHPHSAPTSSRPCGATRGGQFNNSPTVHVCGHLHSIYGVKMIGPTKLVKVGAAILGHYAIIDISTLRVNFYQAG